MSFNMKETKRYLAEHDPLFKRACELAKVQPTARQYSKYRNKRGSAYGAKHLARAEGEYKYE